MLGLWVWLVAGCSLYLDWFVLVWFWVLIFVVLLFVLQVSLVGWVGVCGLFCCFGLVGLLCFGGWFGFVLWFTLFILLTFSFVVCWMCWCVMVSDVLI